MSDGFGNSLIPEEELRQQKNLNFAPMVDFLFLILAIFAVLIVTRTMLYDSDVQVVKMDGSSATTAMTTDKPFQTVLLSINEKGQYKWVTEFNEFLLNGVDAIKLELRKQQDVGLLPKQKECVKILLQIDRHAEWHHVAKAIFALKEEGYPICPIYSP